MSQLSDLLSRHNPPSPDTDPTSGPAEPDSGPSSPRFNRLTGWAKDHPRVIIAIIAGLGVASAAGIFLRPKPAPAPITLAPVHAAPAAHTGKASASKPAEPLLVAPALPGSGAHPASGVPAAAASTPSTTAQTAQAAQARALFMQASQGTVELARIQPVRDGLFAVAYVVSGRSGQAWVDVPAKVVFVGPAVDATGQLLAPGAITMAQGAVTPAAGASATAMAHPVGSTLANVAPGAASPVSVMGQRVPPGPVQNPPVAMAQVLMDRQSGFWDGEANAPRKIWAFVDPDSRPSMEFFEAVQPLIRQGKVRAYWIPVGVYDLSSTEKSAYILSQVGPVHVLRENYASFAERGNTGGSPLNKQSDTMTMRVIQNNRLLTALGRLELPAVVTCGVHGGLTTLYKPTAAALLNASEPCSQDILRLAGLTH